jgi:putative FmdB family regulatory protein
MPLYEYLCDECGHRFERIQKFSDPLADKCPKCGGAIHKLASSPAIQFKGSGFYITDYAKKDESSSAKSEDGKAERAEKSEKTEKSGKADKAEKTGKTEKGGKSDAPAKTDKGSSADPSSSKTSSSPATTSATPSTTKDS